MSSYQLMVIGAGPGGYIAAIKAAQLGLKVGLVEGNYVGGVCLNRGCIPTKTLLRGSQLKDKVVKAKAFGIEVQDISLDTEKLYEYKNQVVEQLRKGVMSLIEANKIDFINDFGYIEDINTVNINGKIYKAENILLATGSRPVALSIPGIDLPKVLYSDDILSNAKNLYSSFTIIGGGVIGVEFATILNALGIGVTIIEAAPNLLPNMDQEIGRSLAMVLKKKGIKIHVNAKVQAIKEKGDNMECTFVVRDKEKIAESEGVLVAVGRQANYEKAVAKELNLEVDKNGIVVDENLATSVPNLYAIGDLAKDSSQLAHFASAQGVNVAEYIAGEKPSKDLTVVPNCVYTNPEIACVGLTEKEAKEQNIKTKTGKYLMAGNGKNVIAQTERSFIKVVFDAENDQIIGAHMMCDRATDMIGELSVAISNKLTLAEIEKVIHPHPTFVEGISEAVAVADNKALHVFPKR